MMSNLAKGALAIALVISAQMIAFGSSRIPRADALAQIAHTAELVRGTMNSDPKTMRFYLDDGLIDSAGDDPRAIALCKEVIEKSTNPVSVAIATGALYRSYQLLGFGPTYREWHWFTSSRRMDEIANILREAWRNPNLDVKLAAAGSLSGMGGKYRDEGYHDYQELLNEHGDPHRIYESMRGFFAMRPEVLSHFDQRVMTSTATPDALQALMDVNSIAQSNRSWSGGNETRIAPVFRHAMSHSAAAVQLTAAINLSRLGKSYAKEARAFFEQRLRQPLGEDDGNTAKDEFIWVIRTMLDSDRPNDIALVKDATKANPQVLEYFEGQVETTWIPNRPINRDILRKWKAILEH